VRSSVRVHLRLGLFHVHALDQVEDDVLLRLEVVVVVLQRGEVDLALVVSAARWWRRGRRGSVMNGGASERLGDPGDRATRRDARDGDGVGKRDR
jgi:hypothetical protein